MDDFGSKILIGAIGAVIALYLKYWYDDSKERKKFTNLKNSFLSFINGNIKTVLEEYKKKYDEMVFDKDHYYIIESHFLDVDMNILNFYSKEQWSNLCAFYNINYNQLNVLNTYLTFIKERSPNNLILEFRNEVGVLNNNMIETLKLKAILRQEPGFIENKDNNFSTIMESTTKSIESLSENYNSKKRDTIIYCNKALDIINDLDQLLSSKEDNFDCY